VKRAALLSLGGFLAGFPLFHIWSAAWAVAYNHSHDHRTTWVVAFLFQVLLGAILASLHRWVYLSVAAGMFLFLVLLFTLGAGPYPAFILAAGWPLALAGLLTTKIKRSLATPRALTPC
jgi:hypothetical protein